MISMRSELTAQSKATIRKLKYSDAMPEFRKEMRSATAPMVSEAKKAIRGIPSSRTRYRTPGGSLRNAVANSIQRKMNLSTRKIMVVIKAVPSGGKSNLGSVLEGTIPWVHPTYGHAPEVHQESHPEFYPTLNKMALGIEKNVYNVLVRFEKSL